MSDSFTDYKKYNHVPGMRPLMGTYEKTVIVVRGRGNAGKSTLCALLLNDKIKYVSTDAAVIFGGCTNGDVQNHLKTYGDDARFNLHKLYPVIAEWSAAEFTGWFFQTYVMENKNDNIIVDGYLFVFEEIMKNLSELCRKNNIRLWVIERSV